MGMTRDEAIKRLKKSKRLKDKVSKLRDCLAEEESKAQYRGIRYSKLPKSSQGYRENMLDKYVQKKIDELEVDMVMTESDIHNIMEEFFELPDKWYKVLYLRYVENLDWRDVADEMNYSISSCERYEKKAFEFLKNK